MTLCQSTIILKTMMKKKHKKRNGFQETVFKKRFFLYVFLYGNKSKKHKKNKVIIKYAKYNKNDII